MWNVWWKLKCIHLSHIHCCIVGVCNTYFNTIIKNGSTSKLNNLTETTFECKIQRKLGATWFIKKYSIQKNAIKTANFENGTKPLFLKTKMSIFMRQNHRFVEIQIASVRVGFCLWAIELARVMKKIPHFGVRIAWGAITSGLPVFQISVSGCSWNSHGTSPNLWVQKNSSSFDKAPKIRDSVLLNSLESFLVTLPSISSETWER